MVVELKTPDILYDLSKAIVFTPSGASKREQKAATVLVEEVEKRTHISWLVVDQFPEGDAPVIILGQATALEKLFPQDQAALKWRAAAKGHPADGYQIHSEIQANSTRIFILGNGERGVLFGVGYLLRHLCMSKESVLLPYHLDVATAPKYSLRGHQLGYRDKTNSYDAWDLPQWDQYIREMAVFGTNAIELIPPRSDDLPDSVHFPRPPMEMMEGMSRIADDYGLDVWIWYPAMDDDYSRPEMVEFALNEWEQVYKRLPRIDAILVPGGDPGNTRPKYLMPMLEKQTRLLHKYHSRAQMWVSAQGFNLEWMNEFLGILQNEAPDWLNGVVYGPWIHMTPTEFRRLVPKKYPIRNYPDITHSLDCQYPIPEWDIAFALTEGRETINPRPRSESAIFRQMGEEVIGFLTYSEGCNDDINKFIWSGLGWDPQQDVHEILRQYSCFFIGEKYTHDFAMGIMALERNWIGPLATNASVYPTLQQFQAIEKSAPPRLLQNWRFQQALYRAYYDAYTRSRLLYETGLEEQAMDRLRQADQLGSLLALDQAQAILDQAVLQPVSRQWRTRLCQLAEALFQSIHMQLSVPLYYAQAETRGANLDGVDYPLNDQPWLKEQFRRICILSNEQERLDQLNKLVRWTDPGPGGYYVDLSNAYDCPFVVKGLPYEEDPGFYRSPHRRFPYWKDILPSRRSWRGYTGNLNDFPFRMVFPNLDPDAQYKVRVVYSDTEDEVKIRLVTDENFEIHPFMNKPFPRQPLEFDIPPSATCLGELRLSLVRQPGLGGLGAGHEISEIWIIKKVA
ncbi:MAG: hypothetical protein ABSE06_00975 [Anaerolineaceae bacterium]|jgi:hypothetical protein